MSNQQTFQAGLDAIQARDWAKFKTLVTDDYAFLGGPMPMNTEMFIAVQDAIGSAFPDFAFHVDKMTGTDDVFMCELHVTASHSNTLTLPIPGLPPIPATHKSLSVPDALKVTMRNGKIASVEAVPVPNGGMGALLKAIGVPV